MPNQHIGLNHGIDVVFLLLVQTGSETSFPGILDIRAGFLVDCLPCVNRLPGVPSPDERTF